MAIVTAAVTDSQGNNWWIATHVEDVAEEELGRRAKGRKTDSGGREVKVSLPQLRARSGRRRISANGGR